MIIDPFNSAKIGIVAVTLFCKYSLDIADMPLKIRFWNFIESFLKRRNLRLVFQDINPAGTEVSRGKVQIIIVIPIAGC